MSDREQKSDEDFDEGSAIQAYAVNQDKSEPNQIFDTEPVSNLHKPRQGQRGVISNLFWVIAKILGILVGLLLLALIAYGVWSSLHPASSGNCGGNVSWSYNEEDETLTISGEGDMIHGGYSSPLHNSPITSQLFHSVIVEDGVTSIAKYTFCNSEVESVEMPDSLIMIGESAFENCHCLKYLEIPNNVIAIEDKAFWNCSSLKEVALGESVANIGYGAFMGNDLLSSVTFPEYVSNIGWGAFSGCVSLRSITFEGNAPSIGWLAFENVVATVYYQPEKAGWEDVVGQNYGGQLKWTPIEG